MEDLTQLQSEMATTQLLESIAKICHVSILPIGSVGCPVSVIVAHAPSLRPRIYRESSENSEMDVDDIETEFADEELRISRALKEEELEEDMEENDENIEDEETELEDYLNVVDEGKRKEIVVVHEVEHLNHISSDVSLPKCSQ
ncbi:hypothetical protein L1887_07276 [Cichorium endivia]|nr:hypothetical protein L1887_07276 [Cichorium endivia]